MAKAEIKEFRKVLRYKGVAGFSHLEAERNGLLQALRKLYNR